MPISVWILNMKNSIYGYTNIGNLEKYTVIEKVKWFPKGKCLAGDKTPYSLLMLCSIILL